MNVLLLGSGGREHALSWKLSQGKRLGRLYIAPGNAGTAAHGTNVSISPVDFEAVASFCLSNEIGMLVVGPEEPLVLGIHDFFLADPKLAGIAVIGPVASGARLEGSKSFSKEFMKRHGIPTAAYGTFTADTIQSGFEFLKTLNPPYVLKADGLAAGKGVLILNSIKEAEAELELMLNGATVGNAGRTVVIEEFLDGTELSVFILTDGSSYVLLPEAKDYKRIGEGDTGPNTGGMGAVSPVPFADTHFMRKITERIIRPTLNGLLDEHIPYKGFVFFGLINVNGDPFVIEYNARLGDPETEAIMPRIKSDLLELLVLAAENRLSEANLETDPRSSATVMLVSGGYPGNYVKGLPMQISEPAVDAQVFHAGTTMVSGTAVTSGGRVIACTGMGNNLETALQNAFTAASGIRFEGCYYRKDIGRDMLPASG